MSYILEALKKVEQERTIGQVPGIASGYEQANRAGFGRWRWLVVGVLVVNALLLAIALWPQLDKPAVSTLEEYARDVSPLPSPESPVPASQRITQVTTAVKPAVPAKPVIKSENNLPVALRPLPSLPEPRPAKDVEEPGTGVPVAAGPAAARVTAEALPRNNNLPVWPQVSSQLFQQINSGLHLDVHVYSKLPEQRFVLINMQKYHEGEQLQEGPEVDEITPSDVILSFRGQRFRVQSQ